MNCQECNHEKGKCKCLCCCSISQIGCMYCIPPVLASVFLPIIDEAHFALPPMKICPDDSDKCQIITSNHAIFAALGVIVVVNLVGFLAFFNRMSHSSDLTKGEMRKTFAITIIMIYLLVLSLIITGHIQWQENTKLFENFTYVMITVIIFYFGSRAYKQARESGNSQNNSSDSDTDNSENSESKVDLEVAETELVTANSKKEKAES